MILRWLLALSWLTCRSQGSFCEEVLGPSQPHCNCAQNPDAKYRLECFTSEDQSERLFFLDIDLNNKVHVVCDKDTHPVKLYESLELLNFNGITALKLERCPNPPDSLANTFRVQHLRKLEIFFTDTFDLEKIKDLHIENTLVLSFIDDLTIREGVIDMPNITSLDINNIKDLKISGRSFEAVPRLLKLKIWRSNLNSVDEDNFHGLEKIKNLFLQDNLIGSLPPNVFDKMIDLRMLQLSNNSLKTLPPGIFKSNKKLERVYLRDNCLLQTLPEQLFSNQDNMKQFYIGFLGCKNPRDDVSLPNDLFNNPSIKSIKFLYLKTKTLPRHLLRGCETLEAFTFQSGNLTEIDKDLFLPTKNIKYIDFANNKISSIKRETLQGLTQLSTLRLLMNDLSEVSAELFLDTLNMTKIELQRNRISRFDADILTTLKYLEDINLSGNLLNTTVLNDHEHPSLRNINLSKNKIAKIDFHIFSKMQKLELIDLSENQLDDYLVFDEELNITRDMTVNLSNNKIKGVKLEDEKENFHPDPGPILTLKLRGNELRCDCFATEIKSRSEDLSPRIDPSDYRCDGGQTLRDTDFSELVCDSQTEGCPSGCQCSVNLYLNISTIKCQEKKITHVPQYNSREGFSVALHLQKNEIKKVNKEALDNLEMVEELHLSGNRIEDLDHDLLSEGRMLRYLSLDNNNIAAIPADTIHKLKEKILSTNLSLRLGENPFHCSCDNVELLRFVREFQDSIEDFKNLRMDCKKSTEMVFLQRKDICPPFEPELVIVFISLLIVAVVVIMFSYAYHDTIMIVIFSHSWGRYLFSEDLLDSDKEYDVFLSYAHQDCHYVEDKLLAGLESPDHQYRCIIHTRNWAPGSSIPDQILESVENSRRTVIVLSKSYVKSVWSNMEFQAAYVKSMEENIQRVVIVLLGEMPRMEDMNANLMKYINTRSYIESEDPWFWKKLRYYLDKKTSRKKKSDLSKTKNVTRDGCRRVSSEDNDLPYFRRISKDALIS